MSFLTYRMFRWRPVCINKNWGLNDIKEGIAYQLCNSVLCLKCGTIFCDIRFDDEELTRLYKGYRTKQYNYERTMFEPSYISSQYGLLKAYSHLNKVKNFILKYCHKRNMTILDWGGSSINNPFIENNDDFNCNVLIYDISSQKAVNNAHIITNKDLSYKRYDLIICAHVLEHVSYPQQLLNDSNC